MEGLVPATPQRWPSKTSLCSDSLLSISSIRIGLEATKGLEIQERCGEHSYSFLSDSHSWQEALVLQDYSLKSLGHSAGKFT